MDDVDDFVMVGGSSKIPKIKETLIATFGEEIKINNDIDPDQVVAKGATFLSRELSGQAGN